MSSLPIRPIPHDNETPGSLLARAAELNGYSSLQRFLVGVSPGASMDTVKAILTSNKRYEKIAQSLGLEITSNLVSERRGTSRKSFRIFNGITVPDKLFEPDLAAFCPHCLSESNYWRREWQLSLYSVCSRHHTEILDKCTMCKSPLTLGRSKISFCEACSANLSLQISSTADPKATQWFMRQMEIGNGTVLDGIWEVALVFNQLLPIGLRRRDIIQLTADFFENERAAATRLLKILKEQRTSQHPKIVMLPLLLGNEKIASLAKDVLSRYQLPNVNFTSEDLSKREAAAVMNVSLKTLHKLELHGLLHTKDSGRLAKISGERIIELLEKQAGNANYINDITSVAASLSEDFLSVSQLSQRLNAKDWYVWQLIKAGFIKAKTEVIDGISMRVIDVAEFNKFTTDYISSGELASRWRTGATLLTGKLRALKIFPVAGPSVDGFVTNLFRCADLEGVDPLELTNLTYRRERQGVTLTFDKSLEVLNAVTVSYAATALKTTKPSVSGLIKRKILQAIPYQHKTLVCKDSLNALIKNLGKKTHLPLDDILKELGCDNVRFKRRWVNTGIVTIIDYGLKKFVTLKDVNKIREIRKSFLTVREASKLLNLSNSGIAFLVKKGELEQTVFRKKEEVSLFRKEDIFQLAGKR